MNSRCQHCNAVVYDPMDGFGGTIKLHDPDTCPKRPEARPFYNLPGRGEWAVWKDISEPENGEPLVFQAYVASSPDSLAVSHILTWRPAKQLLTIVSHCEGGLMLQLRCKSIHEADDIRARADFHPVPQRTVSWK